MREDFIALIMMTENRAARAERRLGGADARIQLLEYIENEKQKGDQKKNPRHRGR